MHVTCDHPRGPRENHLFQEVSCASSLRNTLVCYSGERLVMFSIESSAQKSYPSQRSVFYNNSCPPQPITMVGPKTQRHSFIRIVPVTLLLSPAMIDTPGSMYLKSQNFKARKVLQSHSNFFLTCRK